MGLIIFDKLICGYKINVYDGAKLIGEPGTSTAFSLRITHSPVRFVFIPNGTEGVGFMDELLPINVKESQNREGAIADAIIKWAIQHHDIVFRNYKRHVEDVCEGDCDSRVCLQKNLAKVSPMFKE